MTAILEEMAAAAGAEAGREASPEARRLYAGKRVVVFGLGQFGGQIEAVRFFARAGARVLATDMKEAAKLERALRAIEALKQDEGLFVETRLGGHVAEDFLLADLVVVSPAVPKAAPMMELIRERKIPWTTELALTLSGLRAPVVAVTGSNGKSTTTAMLGEALGRASGRKVFVGGNIGHPLLNELGAIGAGDRAVLELSSFQLEDIRDTRAQGTLAAFAPALALVTNLTPNHLDRHGTMESYAAAKRSLVEALPSDGIAVLNRADPIVLGFAEACRGRVFTFGIDEAAGPGSFVREGRVVFRDEAGHERALFQASEMRLPGRHNLENALAVTAAIGALGHDLDRAALAILAHEGLRDRLEPTATRRGVRYVNDSKATTPEAAAAGIHAFPEGITLLAGGTDKGMDFTPFAEAAVARAARVLLIGRTKERLKEWVLSRARDSGREAPPVALFETLEAAVEAAARETPAGQVVLFSPACASYDMFLSFEDRGDRFRDLTRALPE